MDTHTDAVTPTTIAERIETLDVLRGVAICGILLMNIPYMGLIASPSGAAAGPAFPARWNADWVAWSVQNLLFEGTMRGLFTMLFGAGMLLMLRKAADGHITPIDVWTRRCWALMALGVVQFAVLMWPGEILFCYGVTGFALLAFRTAKPRTLLIAAAIALAAMMAMGAERSYARTATLMESVPAMAAKAAGKPLNDDQKAAIAAREKAVAALHLSKSDIADEVKQRTHLGSVIAWSWGVWSDFNLGVQGWQDLLESLCFMLVGMALYRARILTGGAARSTYATMMAVGYVGGLGLRAVKLMVGARSGYDLDSTSSVPAGRCIAARSTSPRGCW